ncbi:amino acid dehydrogenase [Pandoraea terrae]|uniref:Amino acid dehydrogenase n=1 Tax=Pandoraea terrae TaxID=1537710 RepID=A0A5E4SGM9_9BURK|nr:D-amino acid dehydrogenase [Pandoraea terrae]VVD73872.1 amino acid dehydrogenase [Pandoraea terrae]
MKVIVIGGGVIGTCTAYYLASAGHTVTLVERNTTVAQESSFGNAGVIAPGYVTPWAAPGMPRKLLGYMFSSASPLIFRPGLSAGTWRWALRWLRECKLDRYRANRARMQRLAFYSQQCLHALREHHEFDYEQTQGYLQLFRTERDIKLNEPARAMLAENEVPHRLLTAEECLKLEPALSTDAKLAGGLHLPRDETGNCPLFTKRLAQIAREMGVTLATETTVLAVQPNLGRAGVTVTTAATGSPVQTATWQADAVVMAAGVASAALLRPLGIDVPLWPIKGYSITVPVKSELFSPRLAVMDESYKTAVTPQGNRLRIAGTAELGDAALVLREKAIATLYKVATDWFPGAGRYREARAWVGARPMLPDGPPLLGATHLPGIYLNLGHGSTGWAMACGSGKVLADLLSGQTPDIDMEGLTLSRYAH